MHNLAPRTLPHLSRHRMRLFKKYKKSRQPSQQPAALGIASHIGMVPLGINVELVPNIGPGGMLRSVESRNRWGTDLTTGQV